MDTLGTQQQQLLVEPKWAYVTLLCNDSFLPGVEVMLFSLLSHSHLNIPVIVMITPNVSKTTQVALKRSVRSFAKLIQRPYSINVVLETVDHIPGPSPESHVPGWVNSGYTKLRIWDLQFDRIVYLDADTLVVDCIDELFQLNIKGEPGSFAAAPDVFPPDKFNAGVLVVRPASQVFQAMLQHISVLPTHDGGDTGFLNSWCPTWYSGPSENRLQFGYNAQRTMKWFTKDVPGYWDAVKPLKVIHFSSSPKPWEETNRKGDLEVQWFQVKMESTGMHAFANAMSALGMH